MFRQGPARRQDDRARTILHDHLAHPGRLHPPDRRRRIGIAEMRPLVIQTGQRDIGLPKHPRQRRAHLISRRPQPRADVRIEGHNAPRRPEIGQGRQQPAPRLRRQDRKGDARQMHKPHPMQRLGQSRQIIGQMPRGRAVAPIVKTAFHPVEFDHVKAHATHRIAGHAAYHHSIGHHRLHEGIRQLILAQPGDHAHLGPRAQPLRHVPSRVECIARKSPAIKTVAHWRHLDHRLAYGAH